MFKNITQKHGMGCGVACVASLLNISYDKGLELFKNPANAWSKGFMCREIVQAISRIEPNYKFKRLKNSNDPILKEKGIIVFTDYSEAYPFGHYLINTKNGWMNPWMNYPVIAPAKSGFVKELPAEATYVIYKNL